MARVFKARRGPHASHGNTELVDPGPDLRGYPIEDVASGLRMSRDGWLKAPGTPGPTFDATAPDGEPFTIVVVTVDEEEARRSGWPAGYYRADCSVEHADHWCRKRGTVSGS
jgi:hypothetical protein